MGSLQDMPLEQLLEIYVATVQLVGLESQSANAIKRAIFGKMVIGREIGPWAEVNGLCQGDSIRELGLDVRSVRALEANDICTISDLTTQDEQSLLSYHGLGNASIVRIKAKLEARGLFFGMSWPRGD